MTWLRAATAPGATRMPAIMASMSMVSMSDGSWTQTKIVPRSLRMGTTVYFICTSALSSARSVRASDSGLVRSRNSRPNWIAIALATSVSLHAPCSMSASPTRLPVLSASETAAATCWTVTVPASRRISSTFLSLFFAKIKSPKSWTGRTARSLVVSRFQPAAATVCAVAP